MEEDKIEENIPTKQKKSKRAKRVSLSQKEYDDLREKERLADEYLDRLLRLQAEFDNFRKRKEKERVEFIKFANEGLIRELLTVIDNFERAVDSATKTEDFKLLHQGVEMIMRQFREVLKRSGVSRIESIGAPFDPTKHEAIMQIDSNEHPENVVVEEVQKGYVLNNKVIRPAVVKVAKKAKTKEEKPGASNQ